MPRKMFARYVANRAGREAQLKQRHPADRAGLAGGNAVVNNDCLIKAKP
jgi:hypothetical protein